MEYNGYLIERNANLQGANLSLADLTGADLTGADLTGANPVSYTHLTLPTICSV